MFERSGWLGITTIALVGLTCAHMEMRIPPPRRSKYNPDYQAIGDIDNDMSAPLGDDFPFPCRNTKPGPVYKKYTAGETMDIKLGGNAPHNGGHCQFALSYDGGEKWVVIHTIVKNCMPSRTGPIEFTYQFNIPADAPSSENVVFSWNWINASGEREFYMNCIDIAIEGNPDSKGVRGRELLIVNLPNYPTIDEFARPGSDDGHKLLDNRKNITMFLDGHIEVEAPPPPPAKPPPKPPAKPPAPAPPAKPTEVAGTAPPPSIGCAAAAPAAPAKPPPKPGKPHSDLHDHSHDSNYDASSEEVTPSPTLDSDLSTDSRPQDSDEIVPGKRKFIPKRFRRSLNTTFIST